MAAGSATGNAFTRRAASLTSSRPPVTGPLVIGFDLAFYRWNSRFEATDLDDHEGGLISVPLAVGNRAHGSGKDTVGTAADGAVATSSFTRSIKA